MKLVFVPLKDVFKECKGKRQFSIKKDAYRRFSSVSNEMQICIKKIAALYVLLPGMHGVAAMVVTMVAIFILGQLLKRTLGGQTGDTLGAAIELGELLFLLALL
ncbi:hypothetical protein B0Z61_005126 [Escherichia coli]|nr:hypothetical protein [Escherichia coli]